MASPEDFAWVAGLFEGEGSIICAKVAKGSGLQRRLEITNTERDILERALEIVGLGVIRVDNRKNRPANHKVRLYWQVWRWPDILAVLAMIYPFLGNRRRAAARRLLRHPPTYMIDPMSRKRVSVVPTIVPSNREPTAAEWAGWAAGLFEGEGSAICAPMGPRRNGVQRRLQVPMSDRDVLERLRNVLGAGTVRVSRRARSEAADRRKTMFVWTSSTWRDIERIGKGFYPYLLSRRRRQVDYLLAHPAGLPGWASRTTCKRGHPISGPDAQIYRYGNHRECRPCHALGYRERIGRRRAMQPADAASLVSPNRPRAATCKRGHPLEGPFADVYLYFGWRQCRPCQRIVRRNSRARNNGTRRT
jgi:hypothetical protein